MTDDDRRRAQEALAWALRVHDANFADWEGHAAWLEADADNPEAFDAAWLLIERAAQGLAPPTPLADRGAAANDNRAEPVPARRRGWGAAARFGVAALSGIAALVWLPSLLAPPGRSFAIATAPGQRRMVALADGTRVALNGGTLIRLDRGDPRVVTMERGEAFFTVAHDAAHPFVVRAGSATFQDVGTAFDMVRDPETTEVSVREGAVMFDPGGAAVRLGGGQSIAVTRGGATVRRVSAGNVGQWRSGRLSYDDASLATVARDLSRSIGQPVSVDRSIESVRFSGVIVIAADRPKMLRRVAAITGVSIRQDGAGWRMASLTR